MAHISDFAAEARAERDATARGPTYVVPRRFRVDDDAALAHLEAHGYVVYEALAAGECDEALALLWAYLEGLGSGLRRDDPATWRTAAWPPGVGATGILPWFGVGHSPLAWYVRTRPSVAAAFRKVWRVGPDEPMASSFDGALAWRPGVRTEGGWLHVDQDALRGDAFEMVQGLVNLLPVDAAGTGGNVLVDGSHVSAFPRLAADYAEELEANGGDDYFELPEEDAVHRPGAAAACVLERGDLLLWDSRSVHASTPSHYRDPPPEDALVRACTFVCMVPRSRVPEAVRAERRRAYEEGATTTHWPTKVTRTDGYDSFLELPEAVRLRFSRDPPRAPLTPEIEALL